MEIFKVLGETKKTKKGSVVQTSMTLVRKDEKPKTINQIKKLIIGLNKKTKDNEGKLSIRGVNADELSIRGVNANQWTTLKAFDKDYDEDDINEFYENRVKDPTKLNEFYQLNVLIQIEQ